MILRTFCLLLTSLTLCGSVQAGVWERLKNAFVSEEKPQPPKIKVLLAHDIPAATLEVKGSYNIYDPYKSKRLATRFVPKGNRIQALSTGLKWGEEFPGVYQIEIRPDEASTVTTVNGCDYKGNIAIYDVGGSISVVNEVDLEDYLASMMPNKFNRPFAEESLSAAAIAERTHAFYTAQHSENPYWHVRAEDVGYDGVRSERTNPLVANALTGTRYMVMSKTGIYEGVVTPFPVALVVSEKDPNFKKMSKISIDDIDAMSRNGENAGRILSKTFPEASIALTIGHINSQEQVAELRVRDHVPRKAR